jgi:hypothetical protein
MTLPNSVPNEQLTKAVQSTFASIVRTRQTLKILAPDFRLTIGGNLVGDFGEFIAITEYSLIPAAKGSKDFDAQTQEGRTVQIKANHEASMIGYRGSADLMLVIQIQDDGDWKELYYGDFQPVKDVSRYSARDNKYMVSRRKLEKLAQANLGD